MQVKDSRLPFVIAIVGPTCTGKTALSIRLAQALAGEVIGCDSRTIYKYMDIGTAKPTVEERAGVLHHLFDVVEPDQDFTVAQYKESATKAVLEISSRMHVPIICGGTGLYARALLEGLEIPPVAPQAQLRAEFTEYSQQNGNLALHAKLRAVDAATADRLNANDRFRIIRALEVTTVMGRPFSEVTARTTPPFNTLWIGLKVEDRDQLKRTIEQRMLAQTQAGLIDEVSRLYHQYGCTRALMNAVNYKEFIDHFAGKTSIDEATQTCIIHNSQLARRQLMWFKTNTAINWFSVDAISRDQLYLAVERLAKSKTAS
jgi:tRNA dimethylallyltransferase